MLGRQIPTIDPLCGSRRGYRAHHSRGEQACSRCCEANARGSASDRALHRRRRVGARRKAGRKS